MAVATRAKHTIDAAGAVAGRLASQIATLLQGKHKVTFQPHIDAGDFVNIENAKDMKFTGKKLTNKLYHRFTGYPGGIMTKKLQERMDINPEELLRQMVYGMLPKNKLRPKMIKRLTFIKTKSK